MKRVTIIVSGRTVRVDVITADGTSTATFGGPDAATHAYFFAKANGYVDGDLLGRNLPKSVTVRHNGLEWIVRIDGKDAVAFKDEAQAREWAATQES